MYLVGRVTGLKNMVHRPPVYVVGRVDGLQRQNGLRHQEARLLLRQDVLAHEQRHYVAARQVLHHQVQVLVVLGGRERSKQRSRRGGLDLSREKGVLRGQFRRAVVD